MGDIANDIIDLEMFGCNRYRRTKRNISDRCRGKRKRFKKFTDKQKMNGVIFHLYDKGIKGTESHNVIKYYCDFKNIEVSKKQWVLKSCIQIQKNFFDFKQYIDRYTSL